MAPIDNTINKQGAGSSLANRALKIAISQLGQCEEPQGSNSGPMVDEYLSAVGLSPGYAWCQAFVYWCYKTAAEQMNMPNMAVRTAGVRDCWNRSKSHQRIERQLYTQNVPSLKPGDQFILFLSGGTGHTGIVEQVQQDEDGNWILHTIEGNSNNNGSREGYAVVRHKRRLNDRTLQGFIRYNDQMTNNKQSL